MLKYGHGDPGSIATPSKFNGVDSLSGEIRQWDFKGLQRRLSTHVRIPAAVKRSSEINGMSALTMALGAIDSVCGFGEFPSL
jgi:hypothetical protein